MKDKKEKIPAHKNRVWQPVPASLASLPYTAFLCYRTSIVVSFFINFNDL